MKPPIAETLDAAIPVSFTEGISWPALPSRQATNHLALAQQLDDSQWWPPEMLRRHQTDQLAELLAFCTQTVPFYRDRLAAAGFRIDGRFTPEIWQAMPVLTVAEVRAAGELLLSDAVPTEHGPVATRRVIAADGGAVEVTVSAMAEMIGGAVTLREAQWDGRPLDGKLAVIAAPDDAWQPTSDGPDWGPPFADAYFTGPRAFLDAGARVEAQVAWLRDNESDLLATTPSNLAAIVEHLGTNNTALPRLRYVRTSGRPAAQQLHRASADLWGARLHDGYVDPILGAIAYPCPERGRYHVHAERVVVDVVDDAGRPCPAGRLGRIVVTPLHWFSMPAVRLDTGDLGALVDGCDCGRGLPTLIGVDRPLSQK